MDEVPTQGSDLHVCASSTAPVTRQMDDRHVFLDAKTPAPKEEAYRERSPQERTVRSGDRPPQPVDWHDVQTILVVVRPTAGAERKPARNLGPNASRSVRSPAKSRPEIRSFALTSKARTPPSSNSKM